jgi:hypothetical protein
MSDAAAPQARPTLVWARGGYATLELLEGERVVLISSIPSPPGSRLDASVKLGETSGANLRFKIHGSRKRADGMFVLEARPVDLTRETRASLDALLAER